MTEVEVIVVTFLSGVGVTVVSAIELETGNTMNDVSVTATKVEVTIVVGAMTLEQKEEALAATSRRMASSTLFLRSKI